MKRLGSVILLWILLGAPVYGAAPTSTDTDDCISCHVSATPGIVADWKAGRHALRTPSEALKAPEAERRVSADAVPENLAGTSVGCAECHMLRPEAHKDSYDHAGYTIHTVVTPKDCAVCHPIEENQYGLNIMSHAHGNLMGNDLYRDLVRFITAGSTFDGDKAVAEPLDPKSLEDSCLICHGTVVEVKGFRSVETDYGDFELPNLAGWPNGGVGRINPDGSMGACTPCHSRHRFSIEVARKPFACAKCHIGPDVPVYKVYFASKHGNVFMSLQAGWDFQSVPWTLGRDFAAPTCAGCHVSLLVTPEGERIIERTHRMNDRKAWRLFGLIYAHPEPKSPDTTPIRNRAGLPLPTELTGEPAPGFLIEPDEQQRRRATMEKVCHACHSAAWVSGHFDRLEHSIQTTNHMTETATRVMLKAWSLGLVQGLPDGSPFDEGMEKKWMEQWLFFGNSTRFASAMMGADYGTFAQGRWYMTKRIQELVDWLNLKKKTYRITPEPDS